MRKGSVAAPVAAITGSNGKSTVTSLVGHLQREAHALPGCGVDVRIRADPGGFPHRQLPGVGAGSVVAGHEYPPIVGDLGERSLVCRERQAGPRFDVVLGADDAATGRQKRRLEDARKRHLLLLERGGGLCADLDDAGDLVPRNQQPLVPALIEYFLGHPFVVIGRDLLIREPP